MIDDEEVAAVVAGAADQARLDARVNLTGLLIDLDRAEYADFRRYFMCWQLTRVLAPSLAEKVSPAVARKVVSRKPTSRPQIEPPDRAARPVGPSLAARPDTESHRADLVTAVVDDSSTGRWRSSSPIRALAAVS